jgi:D-alanyl-D-alanine carboxypeptidase
MEAAYNIKMKSSTLMLLLFTVFLAACQSNPENNLPTLAAVVAINDITPTTQPEVTEASRQSMPNPKLEPTMAVATIPPDLTTPTPTVSPSPTDAVSTATITPAVSPTDTVEPTATYWPTVTRQVLSAEQAAGLVPCTDRHVTDELLTVATQQFALPESYEPSDLQLLSDYFSDDVLLGKEHYARVAIIEPLQQIIADMYAAGLQPSILSAYRSYNEQVLAWRWWSSQYPGRVAIMSARPGNSEHQLGDTVDFGSPELDHLFHVDFANTAEGLWLADNAHLYGFTPSYPPDSYAITGFKYEPWHYRYVGIDLATQLYHSGQILTEWQLSNLPLPCIP